MIDINLDPVVSGLLPVQMRDKLTAEIAAHKEMQTSLTNDQRRANISAAHQPGADPRLIAALAAAREEVIRLNVWAENIVLALFAYQSLENDEWVQKVNRRDQKFNVLETHTHGLAPRQSFAVEHDTARYKVDRYSTGVIEYPVEDGLLGRIEVMDEVNRDLIRSWDNLINDTLDPLVTAAMASFTAGTTYVRDSRFISATLPTTNVMSSTSEAAFTFEIFKEIVEHYDLLGKQLRLIRLNPTEMRDTWGWQDKVSSAASGTQDARELVSTRIKDDIVTTGRPSGAILGRSVTYLLDPTYAKKKLQIFSTEPVGTFYEKPNLSRVTDIDELLMQAMYQKENVRGVQKSGNWLGLIYGPDVLNVAEITFES